MQPGNMYHWISWSSFLEIVASLMNKIQILKIDLLHILIVTLKKSFLF